MNKIRDIKTVVNNIKDHDTVAIGGNVLHRAPMSLVREIVRQKKKGLKLVKTAGAHDVDLLVRGKCVSSVDAGFVSYENEYGLASYFRKACQAGEVKMNEHACYTVMSALNAGRINAPFMPVYGLKYGDLIDANDYFSRVSDPFSGEEVTVVKAIVPDVAIIHVSACDEYGNCIIDGADFDDVLLVKAAKKVIVSTEKIISTNQIRLNQEMVSIPSVLVDYIVEIKNGAAPCSHGKLYDIDDKILRQFLTDTTEEGLDTYLRHYNNLDNRKVRGYYYG